MVRTPGSRSSPKLSLRPAPAAAKENSGWLRRKSRNHDLEEGHGSYLPRIDDRDAGAEGSCGLWWYRSSEKTGMALAPRMGRTRIGWWGQQHAVDCPWRAPRCTFPRLFRYVVSMCCRALPLDLPSWALLGVAEDLLACTWTWVHFGRCHRGSEGCFSLTFRLGPPERM